MATPLLTAAEFKKIRWSLVILVVLLSLGAAAVVAALQLDVRAEAAHRKAMGSRLEIRNKLARAQDEEKELREKIAKHQLMMDQGIIGQEHRLDWVEKIRQIKQERKLIDLQYELSPQHAVDKSIVTTDGGGFEVMASPMKLQLKMLHEEDLLNFLADVRQNSEAYVRPRQCTLSRLAPQPREQANAALLSAECQLDWITLREKGKS
jgi:hypothetical protein